MVQQVMPERRSALDTIKKGLEVAQSVGGIISTYDQIKLNEKKKKLLDQEEADQKRRDIGEFTESEKSQVFEVPEGTKGSAFGYFREIERTPEGRPIYDVDTAQPRTKLKRFHYISKDSAQIQSLVDKNSDTILKLKDAKIRSEGGIPVTDITSGKVKNFSLKPLANTVKSFIEDPITAERTPIWIAPLQAKAIKSGSDLPTKSAPPKDIPPTLKSGFYAAQQAGIENPTILQMQEYAPDFVDKKLTDYKKSVGDNDIEIHDALQQFDNQIGIDYGVVNKNIVDKKTPINGITTTGSFLPTQGFLGGIGRLALGDDAARNKAAVTGLINVLLKIRSGAAITQAEADNFRAEIQAAAGSDDPVGLRDAVARIRNKLKTKLIKIELGLPNSVKSSLKENPELPSTYSPLFKSKKEISDEDVADQFMKGN